MKPEVLPENHGGDLLTLSELQQFNLVDKQGDSARLNDLAVDLLQGDYPPVTRLIFRDAKRLAKAITWDSVVEIDRQGREIKIDSFRAAVDADSAPKQEVLLRYDVLDALILDLENRRATRANDLGLAEENGRLVLRVADVGARAIARRLSRGMIGGRPGDTLHDWKYVEFLRGDPEAVRSGAGYHLRITRLPPGEIARLSEAIPYLHAAELLTLLPDPIAADALEVMSPERQLQVFEELDEEEAVRLMTLMAPDAAADLLGQLHPETARKILERAPARESDRIVELLRYPARSIGGLMTNDVVVAPQNWTVAEAHRRLREKLNGPDFVYFIYVVDDEESGRLRGALSLRDLFIAKEDQRLEEIMNPYLITLDPLCAAAEGAYRVLDSHLAALPVVARDGRLLGAVTVDSAVSEVAPASWGAQAPRVFS
jgi:CBS domain-containing protein